MNRFAILLLTSAAAVLSQAASMSFLSLNIRHGIAPDGTVGLDAAKAVIRAANADFVGVQDVDWRAHRSGRVDQAVELGKSCGYHATFSKATFIDETPAQQHGVALLSHEKVLSKYEIDLPGKEPRVVLFCEFTDCWVGVTEVDADGPHRASALKTVAEAAAKLSATKPVYLVDERGGQLPYQQVARSVSVPDPVLPEPAVVPRPAAFVSKPGFFTIAALEPEGRHFACKQEGSVPAEGYRMAVVPEGIRVAASDAAGRFYALQTLRQLAIPRWGRLYVPCCEITDAPRFGWRGMMIDDVRHFFGKAAMRRTLDLLAFHKMNVLHWHLTDDEGWRLPVAKHPDLTVKGAVRPYSADMADRFEDGTYGPFAFSAKDIREIVAYAAARHIRIVPEVDLPGHCKAAIKAYPDLCCFKTGDAAAPKDAVDNVLCLGDDRTLAFVRDVCDSVCDLFPDSEAVHVGGDEVNKVNWRHCPKCRVRMAQIGAKEANGLQSWFTAQLAAHLAKRGRRLVGWDEVILNGEAPRGTTVMSWRGAEGGIAAAKAGLECVMTPHRFCYFNYEQGLLHDPIVYPWWSYPISLGKAYAYDPLAGIPPQAQKHVLGGQCCLWANKIPDEPQLQWQAWPRACATAEVFWSPADMRDQADFMRRMRVHRNRLIDAHVNCAPLD